MPPAPEAQRVVPASALSAWPSATGYGDADRYPIAERERWSFDNVIKLLTSFAFLYPATVSPAVFGGPSPVAAAAGGEDGLSHSAVCWWTVNALAWLLMTVGCLRHHYWPWSRALHAQDHWAIVVGIGLVALSKHQSLNCLFVWCYAVAGAVTWRNELGRMATVTLGFCALIVTFAEFDRSLAVSMVATMLVFVAQRLKIRHSHSAWHVMAALLGHACVNATNHRLD
jgi:hypothetical protein